MVKNISDEPFIATIGWDKFVPEEHFGSNDRTNFKIYDADGQTSKLIDLIDHIDFSRADYVVIDADVLREIKNQLRR